jgi:DNA-binding CsgD family transcriptional regulator
VLVSSGAVAGPLEAAARKALEEGGSSTRTIMVEGRAVASLTLVPLPEGVKVLALVAPLGSSTPAAWASIASLTPAERRVASLRDLGMADAEIARALGCSRDTVKSHIKRIHRKGGGSAGRPPRRRSSGPSDALSALPSRVQQVARLAASGLGNKEVAERLGLAAATVGCHLSAAYRLLGVRGRADLARLAAAATAPVEAVTPVPQGREGGFHREPGRIPAFLA